MTTPPLLVFDFDGVLVDGMPEYWWAARSAALALWPELTLPLLAPEGFEQLRPLIHKGWEMVLMAAELSRSELDLAGLLADYDAGLARALVRWGCDEAQLQQTLERIRAAAIAADQATWLARHRFYPGVVERLRALETEAFGWMVLTTKGAAFAAELLAAAGLKPLALFGHEAGSKPDVLATLLGRHEAPVWFIEDRRPTLEAVRRRSDLDAVRCFLVSWGYLAAGDRHHLPASITWLTPQAFAAPLAAWS